MAFAKDVIIDNQLDDEYLVITELYPFGIKSYIPSVPLVIPPKTKQPPYVIKLSVEDDYLYEVKVSVTKDPTKTTTALPICKSSYGKHQNNWFYFKSSGYLCYEDASIYDPESGYDLDNVPYTIIVAKIDHHEQEN